MSMTGTEIVALARDQLGDVQPGTPVEANYRWSLDKLCRYMTAGLQEICRRNPEARYLVSVTTSPPSSVTTATVGNSLEITDRYRMALVHYISHLCFREDQEDAASRASAQSQHDLYEKALT